jgi:hypothetical protein
MNMLSLLASKHANMMLFSLKFLRSAIMYIIPFMEDYCILTDLVRAEEFLPKLPELRKKI